MSLAQTDFRNVNWGMSKEQVRKHESAEFIGDENKIMYNTIVNGFDCYLFYYFLDDNKLNDASYVFKQKHTNNNDFIDDYKSLKSILSTKYGEGSEDIDWKNDLFKNNFEDYGTAISIGHLKYSSTWKNEKTIINLELSGENYKIALVVDYFAKEFIQSSIKSTKEKNLKDF